MTKIFFLLMLKKLHWCRKIQFYHDFKRVGIGGWPQWARSFKKVQSKKIVKSNISISWKIFWLNFIFCNFKYGQISFFELGKCFKTVKNAISWNLFRFIWFHEFFAWTFLNFLAHYASVRIWSQPKCQKCTPAALVT